MRRLTAAQGPVHGVVAVPGSKSIANRALVVAALAEGTSTLRGLPDGDDTSTMLRSLPHVGVPVRSGDAGVEVDGAAGVIRSVRPRVHTGLAGTTSRFLTALCALGDEPVVVDGDPPLRGRPMADLHAALAALGAQVSYDGVAGRLPVRVRGPVRGGTVTIRGDVSSQFVSALMMIAPVLDGGLTIELTSRLVSRPYVELTAGVMAAFGVDGAVVDDDRIGVPPGRYRATDLTIEADASSASYPLAMVAVGGGEVRVPGLTVLSRQGDVVFATLLARMGCDMLHGEDFIGVRRTPGSPLAGIDVDLSAASDLVPTLAAVAVTASTPTTIRGVGFVRAKESDRLGDLAAELARCGAAIAVTTDGLRIEPAPLRPARLDTHDDHRLAMSFAVLGTVVDGIEVAHPHVVSKSWPGFWDVYDELVSSARRTPT